MQDLRSYTRQPGQSLTLLADRVGVSVAQMSRIAAGKSRPSVALAKRIESQTNGAVSATGLLGVQEEPAVFAHAAATDNDGRWRLHIAQDGSLTLPPDAVAHLGVHPQDAVAVRLTEGTLEVISPSVGIARARALVDRLVPTGFSLVDDLIADRRRESSE